MAKHLVGVFIVSLLMFFLPATTAATTTIPITNNPRATNPAITCCYWKYSCCSFFLDRNIIIYLRIENPKCSKNNCNYRIDIIVSAAIIIINNNVIIIDNAEIFWVIEISTDYSFNRDKCIWNTSCWEPFVSTRYSLFITPFCSLYTIRSDTIFSQKVTYCV